MDTNPFLNVDMDQSELQNFEQKMDCIAYYDVNDRLEWTEFDVPCPRCGPYSDSESFLCHYCGGVDPEGGCGYCRNTGLNRNPPTCNCCKGEGVVEIVIFKGFEEYLLEKFGVKEAG